VHASKHYRREVRLIRKRSALPGAFDRECQPEETSQRRDTWVQLQADSTHRWLFSAVILAAGIIFCLGMAINATTIRRVQRNTQELAGVNLALQKLAGKSRDLALFLEHLSPGEEEMTPTKSAKGGITGLTARAEPTPAYPQAESIEPDRRLAYGKWGPPLLLNASRSARTAGKPDAYPRLLDLQTNLRDLGFDVSKERTKGIAGYHTLQALNEFRLLYFASASRKKALDSDTLAATVRKYADLARKDSRKFAVNSGILAAIRLGSMRTGVDFSFLMELAAAESSFDPIKIAPVTAAAGLFQFKDDTWLEAVKSYGKKYGIGGYASQVENYLDDTGRIRPTIHDPIVHQHVLDLRHNPRISALLAAEHVKYNMKQLSHSLDHEPGYTELYLSHFFGTSGAITFLKVLDENPDRLADEVLPRAAENNQSIFRTKLSKPRTVVEIYKMLDRKFNTLRYKDANPS
jgi:hypothetical protein